MAEAVVSFALKTLGDLLVKEANSLSGVKSQVKDLQDELRWMQSFLRKVDAKQYSDEEIHNWAQDIKNLAYKAQDVIEEYVVKVARRRDGGSGMKKIIKRIARILKEGVALHKVGSKIAIFNEGVTKLKSRLETFGTKSLMEGESSNAASEGKRLARQTYPFEVDKHFIGMDDGIKQVTSLLLDEKNKDHRIISILAMGGSGKTTLVRKIYNGNDIKHGFQALAWVCITQQCQARSVMQDILKQLLPEINVEMNIGQLVKHLFQVQQDKKCLVVIDDIWKVDDWEILSHCFPKVESHSKALFTTRIRDVAEIGFVYELKALNEAEGWQLLRDIAFPQRNNKEIPVYPNQFESIGKAMVRNCGCLPLAIVVLGGILIGKHILHDWESINKEIDVYLMKGKGKWKGMEGQGVVQKVLALSYNDLPYYLKQCFLYFGCFREDENIDPQRLYSLWLAEGMISSDHRESKETMRDVSECYLGELAHRCVVQVEMNDEWNHFGQFKSCHLHDLMRDYCMSKCEEENFLDVIGTGGAIDPHIFRNSCRATMYADGHTKSIISIPSELISNGLRSLQILSRNFSFWWGEIPPTISSLRRFKLLRTLVIQGYDFKGKSLDGIEQLIHLRYLGLTKCLLDRFPSSIEKLSYLKILDFDGTKITEESTVIYKMQKLRYLSLPNVFSERPKRKFSLGGLYELEILFDMSSNNHDFSNLSELKNLQNLRILKTRIYESEALLQFIHYLNNSGNNLTYVSVYVSNCLLDSSDLTKMLTCQNLHCLVLISCKMQKWPQLEDIDCSQLSSSIVQLIFVYATIEEDPMSILERLPNLKMLHFGLMLSKTTNEMSRNASGFPQLVKLSLLCVLNEVKLRIDEGAMPNLSILEIVNCPNLELTIPERLKSLARQNMMLNKC